LGLLAIDLSLPLLRRRAVSLGLSRRLFPSQGIRTIGVGTHRCGVRLLRRLKVGLVGGRGCIPVSSRSTG
jgi:hypothetical protein